MELLLILPILIPLSTAVLCLIAWNRRAVQRAATLAGTAGLLAAACWLLFTVWHEGIQATQMGNWPAPAGITMVADLLSAVMVLVTAIIGVAVVIYSLGSMDPHRERHAYYPLLNVLLLGVCGAFLTGDIFNLFVWFEVMLIASFVLLALGGDRAQLEGAIKYVTLNLVSSAAFLSAVGLLYGTTGTLNMADLAGSERLGRSALSTALAMLFLGAFGIKAAVFPLFFWLPASYHTPPAAISAVFAGLLTKVGVYALIRVFTLIFVADQAFTQTLILTISALTMLTGVLGAAAQTEFRRILSFHIVSQIGYMLWGLGMMSPLALAGSVFYIFHHIIVKTNLFMVSGVVRSVGGSYDLERLGGLDRRWPWLSALFLVPALSLAGLPPLSGFWAKVILVRAGLDQAQYLVVAVALVVSLLTLFSMAKIWSEVFWKAPPSEDRQDVESTAVSPRALALMVLPIILLALLTITIGLGARPFLAVAERAGEQLLDRQQYIQAVLGGRR